MRTRQARGGRYLLPGSKHAEMVRIFTVAANERRFWKAESMAAGEGHETKAPIAMVRQGYAQVIGVKEGSCHATEKAVAATQRCFRKSNGLEATNSREKNLAATITRCVCTVRKDKSGRGRRKSG
jgi:hypothetical protein